MLRANLLTLFIALVWLANGLFAKVLNLVPRHTEIVASILGEAYARPLTILIGCSEMAMAIWIWLDRQRRPTAVLQMAIILTMNTLESLLVPDLLLWGYFNPVFAVLFCGLIWYHGFRVKELYEPA
ncbi:DoxX-like family protein [Neolewinella persica]|uniref:DoxX-like family protein n=1 Tax=Neolewinella persica TaxID=70998 RepID=UPI000373C6B8|nr:DoxX-like family protein [Neolewinella persica]